jgi:RND superfamily putative drug exporter
MFPALGKCVARTWPVVLVFWLVLLGAVKLAAPPWDSVAQDREFALLPDDAPSRQAEQLLAKAFPGEQVGSSIVLVLVRQDSSPVLLAEDKLFIERHLEPQLRQIAHAEGGLAFEFAPVDDPLPLGAVTAPLVERKKSIIGRIRTPNTPGIGSLLVSPDGKARLVQLELTTEFLSRQNWPTIDRVEAALAEMNAQGQVPAGLEILLTGSAIIGRDRTYANLESARATEFWTVVLVVVLLVLIYRSPLLAIVPLATVFLSVQLALGVLALMAQAGWLTLFQGVQIYLTVLTYGAGVDYCLFLMARYQEEVNEGASFADAAAHSVGKVGAALTASAATVVFGIGMMVFADFGKFRQAGYTLPLSLSLVLLASLTFSPALLRLLGRWAFWPQAPRQAAASPSASRWSQLLKFEGFHRTWHGLGQALQRRPGTIWFTTVALMAPFALVAVLLTRYLTYDIVRSLPDEAPSVHGAAVLQAHFPEGLMGPTVVMLVNPKVDFASDEGRSLIEQLTYRLRTQREELQLADFRTLTEPLGITRSATQAVSDLKDVPPEAAEKVVRDEALLHYTTDFGERANTGARLDLIFHHNPFSQQSIANLEQVAQVLPGLLPTALRTGTQLSFSGPTASIRDLRAVTSHDQTRIELLVLAAVFVILLALLRRGLLSLFLLLSVLFSYYTTLGATFALFWTLDPTGFVGLDWKVSLFLFTILIAVGEDYNILLMARIDEEQRRLGMLPGITEALTRTGPIISSCGIIMAGTFASLLAGSLAELRQLGFALAFGVLLDTFVVRPILVPGFLILAQRWREHRTTRFKLPLAELRRREQTEKPAVR